MGWLFSKTLLKWTEPADVRQAVEAAREESRSPLVRPLWVALVSGPFMLLWLVSRADPEKNPPPIQTALLISLAFGLLVVYGVPWWMRFWARRFPSLFPSVVNVTEWGITRSKGNTWKYEHIAHCQITTREFGTGPVSVLVITKRNGSESVVGIEGSVSLEELRRVLCDQGVQVVSAPGL